MQKAPIHQSHIYRQIEILRTIFEKGHSRNIPVKLFQNLTSSFEEEDFLRISSCPYSARSPHSPEPCLWTDQNFARKGHPRNIPVKLFQNLTSSFGEDFARRATDTSPPEKLPMSTLCSGELKMEKGENVIYQHFLLPLPPHPKKKKKKKKKTRGPKWPEALT